MILSLAFATSCKDDNDKYLTLWGGAFGGYCNSDGTLGSQGSWAIYWSATAYDDTNARTLYFDTNGNVSPRDWGGKDNGFTLRCVR